MTNEDFQGLVIEKLTNIENRMEGFENRMEGLETDVKGIKENQDNLARKIDIICEQTAILTEFKTEVTNKLDSILEDNKSIHEILGEHEIAIRTLRRRPV